MTDGQKISLRIGFIILIAILLALAARAQSWDLKSASGFGFKNETKAHGIIYFTGAYLNIQYGFYIQSFKIKKVFTVKGRLYFEFDTIGCKTFGWVDEKRTEENDIVFINRTLTIYKRFRHKPEQITRYQTKNRL